MRLGRQSTNTKTPKKQHANALELICLAKKGTNIVAGNHLRIPNEATQTEETLVQPF